MAENTKRDSNKPPKTKGSPGSPPDRGQPAPGRMPPEKTSVSDDLDLDLDDEDDRTGQRTPKAERDDEV
jgi:hypothetical protein